MEVSGQPCAPPQPFLGGSLATDGQTGTAGSLDADLAERQALLNAILVSTSCNRISPSHKQLAIVSSTWPAKGGVLPPCGCPQLRLSDCLCVMQGTIQSGQWEVALSLLKGGSSSIGSLSISSLDMASLPSSLDNSSSITMEHFLCELGSLPRSSSTERWHELLTLGDLQACSPLWLPLKCTAFLC